MKLKRFHSDIFFPENTRENILRFGEYLKGIKLKYSYHALVKLSRLKNKEKKAIHLMIRNFDVSNEDNHRYIFEFYASKEMEVKKVCFRVPLPEIDSDVILVISSTARIVTLYINNNPNNHRDLNLSLYEKEFVNEG